jgi:mRNA interferase MazF
MRLLAGSLVTVSFPFTDLSAVKRRPALVLVVHREEVVLCGVTSKLSRGADAVPLEDRGMVEGRLPKPSEIWPLKLFTIHRALIHSVVGRVSEKTLDETVRLLVSALRSGKARRAARRA